MTSMTTHSQTCHLRGDVAPRKCDRRNYTYTEQWAIRHKLESIPQDLTTSNPLTTIYETHMIRFWIAERGWEGSQVVNHLYWSQTKSSYSSFKCSYFSPSILNCRRRMEGQIAVVSILMSNWILIFCTHIISELMWWEGGCLNS